MEEQSHSGIARNRLEALVDGIFAFAMTLLVTGLFIPPLSRTEATANLAIVIGGMQSQFISFVVAFFVLASFWHMHNRQFHHVRRIDPGLLWITLLILACVVLIPFTTNLSGDYAHVQLAVGLFHTNMFGLGFLLFVHWWYLTKHPEITSAEIAPHDAARGGTLSLITPAAAALGFALSFASPGWSMASYLVIPPCVAIARRCHG